MAKLDISVNLLGVFGAFTYKFHTREGAEKPCVCIPYDELSLDKNGKLWLNINAFDDTKYPPTTHSLKQRLSKAQYQSLPQENGRKVLTPYIGSVKSAEAPSGTQSSYSPGAPTCSSDDDLPF